MKIKSQLRTCWSMSMIIGLTLMFVWICPAVAQEAQKEVEYEAGFYYTVKKGDTLWDISQRFNDTPWQWPDLWKENEQLPNPHWIYPGERIRLYRKGDKHRYEEKAIPQPAPEVETAAPEEPLPEPEVNFYYPKANRYGFIRKPPVEPLGIIFKSKGEKELISHDDIVYIRPSSDGRAAEFAAGSRYTVYRMMDPTDDPDSREEIGTQHYLLGIVEVTQRESRYAIAKVIDTYSAISMGDALMTYRSRSRDIRVTDSTPGIMGQIINGEEHPDLVSSNTIAFIDKGKVDNIVPGQEYTIAYQDTVPDPNDKNADPITLAPIDIGSVIVLHTEETTSTVLVTSSRGKIAPGFMIKTP